MNLKLQPDVDRREERNYPEEFAFSAAIQKVVERDQVLPTQGSSSVQGTGRSREKKVQEGFM